MFSLYELLMPFRNKFQQLDSKTFCFSSKTFEGVVNRQTDGFAGNKNLKMTAYIQRLLHVESVSEHYLMTDSDIPHKQEWATSKMPLRSFQTDAVCPAVHMNTTSHFHANETNFYEMLCTKSGFERKEI